MQFIYLIIFIRTLIGFFFSDYGFMTPLKSDWIYQHYVDLKDFNVLSQDDLANRLSIKHMDEKGNKGLIRVVTNLFNKRLEIYVKEQYVGDDSVGPTENKYIVEKQNKGWKLIKFQTRHTCRRYSNVLNGFFALFVTPWTSEKCG